MKIMTREMSFGKVHQLLATLLESVEEHGRQGERVDVVERHALEELLNIGLEILSEYISAAGNGDQGKSIEHGGRKLIRLKGLKKRVYFSIFGRIDCQRYVYGSREKQKAKWVEQATLYGCAA